MNEKASIYQSKTDALQIIKDASRWLKESGKEVSEWWDARKIDEHFFDNYANDTDFFVLAIDNTPAACAILQEKQNLQDWTSIDGTNEPKALYIHYLAVDRRYAGQGLSKILLDFAKNMSGEKNLNSLRLDTNADEPKLCTIYEDYGFKQLTVLYNEGHKTALYELVL